MEKSRKDEGKSKKKVERDRNRELNCERGEEGNKEKKRGKKEKLKGRNRERIG